MQYVKVLIKRDTNTTYNTSVPAWEVPVLEFIFEDGNIQLTAEVEDVPARDYPDAAFEFDRLTRAYGADPQSGVAYVASVYGQASAGVRALAKAIAEAKADEADASEAPASKAPPKRAPRASARLDALLG